MDSIEVMKKSLEDNLKAVFEQNKGFCFASNNNFSYYAEQYNMNPTETNMNKMMSETKAYNFVPTYDKWCLFCGKVDTPYKCSRCKSVYFCDSKCQKDAWSIHKLHCKSDLFRICIVCGNNTTSIKCNNCPVKFCSQNCLSKIERAHREFDCEYFHKTFGSNQELCNQK